MWTHDFTNSDWLSVVIIQKSERQHFHEARKGLQLNCDREIAKTENNFKSQIEALTKQYNKKLHDLSIQLHVSLV